MKEESVKRIKELAGELYELYNIEYEQLAPMVYHIINDNVKDVTTIEWHLDQLLNSPIKKSLDLFLELCAYYAKIEPENAAFYYEEYDEIYGEEEPKIKKKTTN